MPPTSCLPGLVVMGGFGCKSDQPVQAAIRVSTHSFNKLHPQTGAVKLAVRPQEWQRPCKPIKPFTLNKPKQKITTKRLPLKYIMGVSKEVLAENYLAGHGAERNLLESAARGRDSRHARESAYSH
jgi:hypothetical protein